MSASRLVLESRWFVAALILYVYSMLALLPSLAFPVLWRWQNRLANWADDWAFEPLWQARDREPS